jgi:hypothetical protein
MGKVMMLSKKETILFHLPFIAIFDYGIGKLYKTIEMLTKDVENDGWKVQKYCRKSIPK